MVLSMQRRVNGGSAVVCARGGMVYAAAAVGAFAHSALPLNHLLLIAHSLREGERYAAVNESGKCSIFRTLEVKEVNIERNVHQEMEMEHFWTCSANLTRVCDHRYSALLLVGPKELTMPLKQKSATSNHGVPELRIK